MSKSRMRGALYGLLGGSLLGLVALVLVGGRFALGSVISTPVREGAASATTDFVIASGGLYLAVLLVGLLAGVAFAGISYGVNRAQDPDSPRFPLRYLLVGAGLVSAITGYALLRAGLGAFADITAGVVTIPVLSLILVGLIGGALTGAITADVVGRLAHPKVLGLEGAAWPTSGTAMVREMSRAVGTPIIALIVAMAVAVPFSQLLLAAEGTLAVAIFSIMGALVLGAAALLAYRPWDRNSDQPAG